MASLTTLNHVNNAMQQNVDFKGTKPALKKGSPAAKVAQGSNQIYRQTFGKTSEAQLRHQKKISANTTMVTSTLGLGAAGAAAGGALTRKVGAVKGSLKLMRAGRNLTKVGVPVSLTAGAISGASGYNNASIQRAEARRRNQTTLIKAYDPEYNRQRRNKVESVAAATGGAGALGGAGYLGQRALRHDTKNLHQAQAHQVGEQEQVNRVTGEHNMWKNRLAGANAEHRRLHAVRTQMDVGNKFSPADKRARTGQINAHLKYRDVVVNNIKETEKLIGQHKGRVGEAARAVSGLRKVRRVRGVKAGALGLAGAGALGGAAYLHRKPSTNSWASYSPRYRPQS
jgi:hypothetical protein